MNRRNFLNLIFIVLMILGVTSSEARMSPAIVGGSASPSGHTDYTANANCQGAWLLADNGNDESGEVNTLSLSADPPAYDITVPTQYSTPAGKSLFFVRANSEYAFRSNANCSAAFPGKVDTAAFTISLWIKRSVTTAQAEDFIAKEKEASWGIGIWNAGVWGINGRVDDGVQDVTQQFTTAHNTTNWRHICWTFNAGDSYVWISSDGGTFGDVVNGTNLTYASVDLANGNASGFTLGCNAGPANYFDGYIYEPAVFNSNLSSSDCESIYLHGIKGTDG